MPGVFFFQGDIFLKNSPEDEYCQSLCYQWVLNLLPFFLERSALSLELATCIVQLYFCNDGMGISTENEVGQGGDCEVHFKS